MALALVVIARRLRPYFLSHLIEVMTNLPLKQTLGTSEEGIPQAEKWLLHVEGSSTTQDSGAGIILISLQGEYLQFVVKFGFKASNNEVEYEAFVTGLKMTHEVGARHVIAYSDSQYPISYKAKEENMIIPAVDNGTENRI
ncbi:UNVERIFIED_CONTAM: hypothetical protein Sindi_0946400 [Sesamum indicum]